MSENLILKAITHGAVAGGLRQWTRTDERLRSGFGRAADFHSDKAATLLDRWIEQVSGTVGAGPPPLLGASEEAEY